MTFARLFVGDKEGIAENVCYNKESEEGCFLKKRWLVGVTTSVLGVVGAGVWKGLQKLNAQQPFTDVYAAHLSHEDALEYAIVNGAVQHVVEGEQLQQLLATTARMTLEEKARAVNAKYELQLHSVKGDVVYVTVASPSMMAVNGVTYKVINGEAFYARLAQQT